MKRRSGLTLDRLPVSTLTVAGCGCETTREEAFDRRYSGDENDKFTVVVIDRLNEELPAGEDFDGY